MSKRLDDLDESELKDLFERLGKLIDRALPPGQMGGNKCGFVLLLVDAAKGEKSPTCVQYTSNVDRDAAPELLHEVADYIEQEIDAEEAERDELGRRADANDREDGRDE